MLKIVFKLIDLNPDLFLLVCLVVYVFVSLFKILVIFRVILLECGFMFF